MSVREAINGKKALGIVAGVVLVVAAGVIVISQLKEILPPPRGQVYFTDDEQTTFMGTMAQIAPFDHNGKTAVIAHVFKCNGKEVIGYVQKLTDEAKAALLEAKEAGKAGRPPAHMGALISSGTTGTLVKRVGKDPKTGKPYEWVSMSDIVKATAIRVYKCKESDTSSAEELDPG